MKNALTIFGFLTSCAICQGQCEIKIEGAQGPIGSQFYVQHKNDSIVSQNGVLRITKEFFDKYKDEKFKVRFYRPELVEKLYSLPEFSLQPKSLNEICGQHKLTRRKIS